jgi:hypothetical protein
LNTRRARVPVTVSFTESTGAASRDALNGSGNHMAEPTLDLTDIQGNVLIGYGFPFARYCFLEITNGEAARRALSDLIPLITTSEWWTERTPDSVTNIAFTWRALVKLELPPESLAGFPFEFQAGMQARADVLNDVRRNAPENWDKVWQTGQVDVVEEAGWISHYRCTPIASRIASRFCWMSN